MSYDVIIFRSARKDLARLPAKIQERIEENIAGLAEDPRTQETKKLQGRTEYRLRVGEYRVLYEIDDDTHTVTVYRVARKTNTTYR